MLAFAFCTFVLGGFSFGWLFFANWKLLGQFQAATIRLPGGPTIAVAPRAGRAAISAAVGRTSWCRRSLGPRRSPPAPADARCPGADQGPAGVEEDADQHPAAGDRPPRRRADRREPQRHDHGGQHRPAEQVGGDGVAAARPVRLDPGQLPAADQRGTGRQSALVAQTIQANFGIAIDNYARVDFSGFEQVVDAVGGVVIDVERPVKDDEYPTEDYGTMRLFIPPGPMLLDGKTALMYARSRHSESDFRRSQRQQRVLLALRERAMQMNIVTKIPTLLADRAEGNRTDLRAEEMVQLGRLGLEIERDRVKTVVVDATYATPFLGPQGENLLMPSRQAIQQAILRAFNEATGRPPASRC